MHNYYAIDDIFVGSLPKESAASIFSRVESAPKEETGLSAMDANAQRPTAQILSFPAGGRRPASNLSAKAKFAAEVRALRKLKIAPETAWYHQEAIEDATPTRKN